MELLWYYWRQLFDQETDELDAACTHVYIQGLIDAAILCRN